MRTISSVLAMQRLALKWRRLGPRVGFVPTMGYLHEGHLSLVHRARRLVGPRGKVVVSLYVNPTQFGPREDFSRYPRDFARDAALCRDAGVDVLFAPTDAAMYPGRDQGRYSTYVVEKTLSQSMEGASRPAHFRGVTTIVAKLFNIVLPDVAVFGAKDWQQAAIIQRMAMDLNFPLKVVVAPTKREPDGLAMSSRNKYLVGPLRPQARALWQAIQTAQAAVRSAPTPVSAARLKRRLCRQIEDQPDARVDYIEFFEPETLASAAKVRRGTHLALAVFIGTTRLIDNARL
ncbi:MAG: pantoate--beta-alanine ligase [Verrucomicrobia bacterium]|nr:pantoate--beta-alanine ligase [Verrucomicrobiota bacterium]